jgi:hypothetical protein
VGFSTGVVVRAGDDVVAGGRLTIRPVPGSGCTVALALTAADDMADAVERDARRYVAKVATVSRDRSSAA